MELAYFELFFLLLIGHAIADFALQNDFMAMAKNHTTDLGKQFWHWVLPAHALIHSGFVYMITGSFTLTLVEFIAHSVIDFAKCDGEISLNMDQFLHIACKALYVVLLVTQVPLPLG
jgi:hypothetical protein